MCTLETDAWAPAAAEAVAVQLQHPASGRQDPCAPERRASFTRRPTSLCCFCVGRCSRLLLSRSAIRSHPCAPWTHRTQRALACTPHTTHPPPVPSTCARSHFLADKLEFKKVRDSVAVHVPCSSKKMGIEDSFMKLAGLCSHEVVGSGIACCGMAGDRGMRYPELTGASLQVRASTPLPPFHSDWLRFDMSRLSLSRSGM